MIKSGQFIKIYELYYKRCDFLRSQLLLRLDLKISDVIFYNYISSLDILLNSSIDIMAKL